MSRLDYTPVCIDPGANGGVVYTTEFPRNIVIAKIPDTLDGVFLLFRKIRKQCHKPKAFLEHNTGFMAGIKSSTNANGEEQSAGVSPVSMYNFGRNTGHLEMALIANDIPVCRVTPIKWQNAALVTTPKKRLMTPAQWKNHLKAEAQRRFPAVKVTLANADALLILDAVLKGGLKHTPNLK
jgi:hypothetical protein